MRAIIVGAGWSGALAFAAIRPFCSEVVVIERGSDVRGTDRPQGHHKTQLHNLVTAGLNAVERLLPGFGSALLAVGGVIAKASSQTHVFEAGVWMPRRDLGLAIATARPGAFAEAAWRVLDTQGCQPVITSARATALIVSEGQATGVSMLEPTGHTTSLGADFVVDASGGGLKIPRDARPPVCIFRSDRWFASFDVCRLSRRKKDTEFWLLFPWKGTRGMLMSPIGPGRWVASASGSIQADPPPRSWDDIDAHLEVMGRPAAAIRRVISASMTSPISIYRQPRAAWRRFDLVKRPLRRYFPIGDAIARQAPLLGQGMSVAACQAIALFDVMGEASSASSTPSADNVADYLLGASRWAERAWQLNASSEGLAKVDSGASELRPRDIERIARRVTADAALHKAYVGYWHLVTSAERLKQLT
jgi:2-polyprenyl-6-methoxyphenol hydroxylase-like FAD-dependent oxidoreductase